MKLIQIGYCGKKESQDDNNVAGTKLVWARDEETVHAVTPEQAAKFLVHTDSWYKVGEIDAAEPVTPKKPTKPAKEEELFVNVNLEAMTKDALAKYAHRTFNVELDQSKKKPALVEEVTRLQQNYAAAADE